MDMYKKGEDNKNNILEIVPSMSEYFLLEKIGNKNDKICLSLELGIGKLDSLKDKNRINLKEYLKYSSTIGNGPFINGYSFDEEFKKIQSTDTSTKIRVWSSELDCDNYCLLLFICKYFGDRKISVVFSNECNEDATTCSSLNETEIKFLMQKEHNLTNIEISNYAKQYDEIVSDNKELRYIIDGVVKSVDINEFDDQIIKRLSNFEDVYIYKFILSFYTEPLISNTKYSDYVYLFLINRLINNGIINQITKDNKMYIYLNKKV